MMAEENQRRSELMERYHKEAKMSKYRHKLAQRSQTKSLSNVIQETGKYTMKFLFLNTDDETLYEYKRKLQKEIQWRMAKLQWLPIGFGYFLFRLTRRLKHKSSTDVMYFIGGYMFLNYGIFVSEQHKLFEIAYPAHPYILEKRADAIN